LSRGRHPILVYHLGFLFINVLDFLKEYLYMKSSLNSAIIEPELSDFLFDLHRPLWHQGSGKILDRPTGMPVRNPDLFSGRFLRTLLHQDFGTSLQKKIGQLN
jgi:hypothetical protein